MEDATLQQLQKEVYIPLKEYFERLLDAMQRQNELRISATDARIEGLSSKTDSRFDAVLEAVRTFNAANEKRNEVANEFRSTIEDQQTTFATKSEVSTMIDRITALERSGAAGQERFPTRTEWAATNTRVGDIEKMQATAQEKFIKREDLANYDRRIIDLETQRSASDERFIKRSELESTTGRVEKLEQNRANMDGRMAVMGAAFMVAMALIGLAIRFL